MGHKPWDRPWKRADKMAEKRIWKQESAEEAEAWRVENEDLYKAAVAAARAQDWEGLLLLVNAQPHDVLVQFIGNLMYTIAYARGEVTDKSWEVP